MDLARLSKFSAPPNKNEWEQLTDAEASMGMNVCGDPSVSGRDGLPFLMTDILRPIMGDEFNNTPKEERSREDKEKFGYWCRMLSWYMNLKRAGIEPTFSN